MTDDFRSFNRSIAIPAALTLPSRRKWHQAFGFNRSIAIPAALTVKPIIVAIREQPVSIARSRFRPL